jgi:hypothetical protein
MTNFEDALLSQDLKLFEAIGSQTSPRDKRSMLACQAAVRAGADKYVYLEIGSHLGGSLQPYVLDPRCRRIYSIDKRPAAQPDERGEDYVYTDNSTERMMRNLRSLSVEGATKITCIDADSSEVPTASIDARPDLCFIDGEHTDRAVVRDFAFCRRVVSPNGAILFHDAHIVYLGLDEIVRMLEREGVRFRAYHLPDVMFVIEFGDSRFHETPAIHEMLINNHVGYLRSLRLNDHFRAFTNRPIFQTLRGIRRRLALPWRGRLPGQSARSSAAGSH